MAKTMTLEDARGILAEVADIFEVLVDPGISPDGGSLAVFEMAAASREPARDGFWGDEPVRRAYSLAEVHYLVALDHARAMVALMDGRFTAMPIVVLARACVEAAAQAWWLLEPGLGHIDRVRRLQTLRHRSAYWGERFARSDGAVKADHQLYTETLAEVAAYSEALRLDVPTGKGSAVSCGGQTLPSLTKLVGDILGQIALPSGYGFLSGHAHAELFVLQHSFAYIADLPEVRFVPVCNEQSAISAAGLATYALYPPGERLQALYGLDRPEAP